MKTKYTTPEIEEQKIKVNHFLNNRFFDSVDVFLVPQVYAASSSPCASGSTSNTTETCDSVCA